MPSSDERYHRPWSPINPGDKVIVTDAFGVEHERIATSGVCQGHSMPIVWVCSPSCRNQGAPFDERPCGFCHEGPCASQTPWPYDSVRLVHIADDIERVRRALMFYEGAAKVSVLDVDAAMAELLRRMRETGPTDDDSLHAALRRLDAFLSGS